jgi:hypothetical protein
MRTRASVMVLAFGMLVGTTVLVPPVHAQTFADVDPSAFYARDVEWLVASGITTGIGPGLFGPDLAVTRSQAVTFLYRYSGSPEGAPGHGFSDVQPNDYFDEPVKWAFLYGITAGVTPSLFGPGSPLTRAQMVTFLHRCAGLPEATPDQGFVDVPPSAFYATAVAWAKQAGITTGTGVTTFSPDEVVTRGQIASFLKRLNDAVGGTVCAGTPPNPVIQPDVIGSAAPGTSSITILNAAPETLRFSMGGPTPTLEILDPCPDCDVYLAIPPADACTRPGVVAQTVTVDPGRYRVAFEALSGGATPLFAEWLLNGGVAYEFCVVITTS